jgi:formylglycine-generating enzyme required for sulfatase activity
MFPQGRVPCGALDMAGNVWEWCCSSYRAYPQGATERREDVAPSTWDVPLRGGSFYTKNARSSCGSRFFTLANYWNYDGGFRMCQSLALNE